MLPAEPPLQQERGVRKADAKALVLRGALRKVLDRRLQFRKRVLPDHLDGSPKGDHVEAQAPALELQQLLKNERL